MSSSSQSRKWLLTINNPGEPYSHEAIICILKRFPSLTYYCLSDEMGLKEQTPHTHVFFVTTSPVRFSTIKKRFPTAHIDVAHGTSDECRCYIAKSGKWENDDKHGTSIPGTFEEWGDIPDEQPGKRSDWDTAFEMLGDGSSVIDVIRANKQFMRYRTALEQTRQELLAEQFRTTFRELETTYIYGTTGLGKTRLVMEENGYENVCQITGYQRGCFDKYKSEPVLLLDEFSSSFSVQDINNFLDGYPLHLPARYADRVACYTRVFIVSNIRLEHQYPCVRLENPAIWDAFLRRIHKVLIFYDVGKFDTYTTQEYFDSLKEEYRSIWKGV